MQAEKLAERMAEKMEAHTDLIAQAEAKITQLSRQVAQKVSTKKIAKLDRQIARVQAGADVSASAITKARVGGAAARGLQIVFAAHDIYEGWEDFEKAWNSN